MPKELVITGVPCLMYLLIGANGGNAGCLAAGSGAPSNRSRPATNLIDQDGRNISLADCKGRITVVNFIFTHCPNACPAQMNDLVYVQKTLPASLRARVQFFSVSVDPEKDTPEVLRTYARDLGADLGNWSFVTGPQFGVEELAKQLGAQIVQRPSGELDHTLTVYLLDTDGQLILGYSKASFHRSRLLDDIRAFAR
jgi:protein SCO1/2